MVKQQNVLFIDSNIRRLEAMAKAFHQLASLYTFDGLDYKQYDPTLNYWKQASYPDTFLLQLIHGRDEMYHRENNSQLTIWYGGSLGNDINMREGDFSIFRAINTAEEALNAQEAIALINFVQNRITPPPPFLLPTTYDEKLELILNYLHLYYTVRGSEETHSIQRKLEDLNFSDIPTDLHTLQQIEIKDFSLLRDQLFSNVQSL